MDNLESCLHALKNMADHGVTSSQAIDDALKDYLSGHPVPARLQAIVALDEYLKVGGTQLEPRAFWSAVQSKAAELVRVLRAG
jgi:hypothetical protein